MNNFENSIFFYNFSNTWFFFSWMHLSFIDLNDGQKNVDRNSDFVEKMRQKEKKQDDAILNMKSLRNWICKHVI